MSIKTGALFIAWNLLLACCPAPGETSRLEVANGKVVSEAAHPSVALLVMHGADGQYNCTGTFVSSSVVLTAAHCVEPLKAADAGPMYYVRHDADGKQIGMAVAQSAVQFPGYDIKVGHGPNDLAIVRFPEGTAPAVSAFGPTPAVGEAFTIVGFGANDFSYKANGELKHATGALTLRTGNNVIYNAQDGMLYFAGVSKATVPDLELGTEVSAGKGDSGGPMFVNGKLVGVASGVGYGGDDRGLQISVSAFVDINSATSQEFLRRVKVLPVAPR